MITEKSSVSDVVSFLREGFRFLPNRWWDWNNAREAHKVLAREFIEQLHPVSEDRYSGRGIVIPAGGKHLFTNGYVAMRMLRHVGCQLPIQFWHFRHEVDDDMRAIAARHDASFVDADDFRGRQRPRILNGWELKPFAMLHCPFREVLLLDADNVVAKDPTFLFDCKPYLDKGAIFWPDRLQLSKGHISWRLFEADWSNYPNMQEVESGQVLVDKVRHWQALNLAMHMNEHSDYWYRFFYGDKITFELSWKRLQAPFHMTPGRMEELPHGTMCQKDPVDGSRLFQHRSRSKWQHHRDANVRVAGFTMEDECFAFLDDLLLRWDGELRLHRYDERLEPAYERLRGKTFLYHRIAWEQRPLELLARGTVGRGAATLERRWTLSWMGGRPVLSLREDNGNATCHLVEDDDGKWRGSWISLERCPIELEPS